MKITQKKQLSKDTIELIETMLRRNKRDGSDEMQWVASSAWLQWKQSHADMTLANLRLCLKNFDEATRLLRSELKSILS